jgi:hypothetical protein
MQINPNEEGGYDITRRNSKVDVYIDEFRLSPTDPIFVNPADIAMIKVFDPLDDRYKWWWFNCYLYQTW